MIATEGHSLLLKESIEMNGSLKFQADLYGTHMSELNRLTNRLAKITSPCISKRTTCYAQLQFNRIR